MESRFKPTALASSLAASTAEFLSGGRSSQDLTGQGRLHGFGPVAVIDIGSNSVRLVAYERLSRALTPLYNEKVLCGLGRGIASTGQLSEEAVELALKTLRRFRHLCAQMEVRSLSVIATAAARDASNGAEFLTEVQRVLGVEPQVLTGEEEARAAALGIQSGFYQPEGLVGDLGGGSLELVPVDQAGGVGEGTSLQLGVIRLSEESDGDPKRAREIATERLEGVELVKDLPGRTLYLIGGTWRNLAKLHMALRDYPLSVMHGYTVEAKPFAKFCKQVLNGEFADHPQMVSVSRSRRTLLPYGAAVLRALCDVAPPAQLTLSALGVREGLLYDRLAPYERERDPLLESAFELAILRSRSPKHAQELADWTGEALAALEVDETEDEARYRRAASLLADIGWRAHPDYRGTQSLNIIAHAAFAGVDHGGRLFLALANYHRHEGLGTDGLSAELISLIPDRLQSRAVLLGALFRVAYALTASMAGILPETQLKRDGDKQLTLTIPGRLAELDGERLTKRLGSLAKLCKIEDAAIKIGD